MRLFTKKLSKSISLRSISIALMGLSVVACDTIVEKTAVSISSNAYYTVFQDSVSGSWQTRLNSYRNTIYRPIAISFTVPKSNSQYSIGFVCPSAKGTKPHEIYLFYATPAEMDSIRFNCKRASNDILLRPLYGKITGVNLSTLTTQGEQAHIALGRDESLKGWEGYASMVRSGERDVIAYKRDQFEVEPWKHKGFYIKRKVAPGLTEEPVRVDLDLTGNDFASFYKAFDLNSLSTVNISGVNPGDVVESSVGFLSNKKSYLSLVSSVATNFSFLPAPLERYTGALGGFTNENQFNPGEGHELEVKVNGTDGKPLRKAYKFFTESNAVSHAAVLPKAIGTQPVVGLKNKEDLQELVLNWSAYSDLDAGKTQLYRWYFKGAPAEALADFPATVNVGEVDWIVHVTPGWINAVSGSSQNYSLVLPSEMKVDVKDNAGKSVYAWRQEWGMKPETAVEWEFTAIVVDPAFTAEDVIEYYLNRNFDILTKDSKGNYAPKDFVFAESFARGISTP